VEFRTNNSVVSKGSPCEPVFFTLLCFKLSLGERSELKILVLKTIVVHGLLSFHHLGKFGQNLRQRLQQQQQSQMKK
jgi:hypothetical protein